MTLSRRLLAKNIATRLAAGEPASDVLAQLAAYVVVHHQEKDQERIVNDICLQLQELGSSSANVTTARPLTDQLRSQLEAYVKKLNASNRVTLVEHVDPAIKGGVIIETPTKRYDASIATKLKQLRNLT